MLDRDGYDDIAIGRSSEDSDNAAGSLLVFFGSATPQGSFPDLSGSLMREGPLLGDLTIRREAAGDLDIVVQFDFRGEDAQQAHARISEGILTVVEGLHENPDLAVEADASAWLALVNGEADPAELFMSGTLLISGDMDLMMRLADLIAGGAESSVFDGGSWKLKLDYADMLTLDLGQSK